MPKRRKVRVAGVIEIEMTVDQNDHEDKITDMAGDLVLKVLDKHAKRLGANVSFDNIVEEVNRGGSRLTHFYIGQEVAWTVSGPRFKYRVIEVRPDVVVIQRVGKGYESHTWEASPETLRTWE